MRFLLRVNYLLILGCVGLSLWAWQQDPNFIDTNFVFSWNNLLAGRVWTLFTALFLHASPTHLFGNLLFLFVFGNTLEKMVGRDYHLAVFFIGGFTAFNELLERTHGHNFYDNRATLYSGSANDAALNAGVKRYRSEPAGVNYVANYYTPTGRLSIPLLTLHTTQDPSVPFSEEATYAGVVASGGRSNFLVQQSVNRFGHCNFKPEEILNSFQSLILWVNFGIKPPGGDVTVP